MCPPRVVEVEIDSDASDFDEVYYQDEGASAENAIELF